MQYTRQTQICTPSRTIYSASLLSTYYLSGTQYIDVVMRVLMVLIDTVDHTHCIPN